MRWLDLAKLVSWRTHSQSLCTLRQVSSSNSSTATLRHRGTTAIVVVGTLPRTWVTFGRRPTIHVLIRPLTCGGSSTIDEQTPSGGGGMQPVSPGTTSKGATLRKLDIEVDFGKSCSKKCCRSSLETRGYTGMMSFFVDTHASPVEDVAPKRKTNVEDRGNQRGHHHKSQPTKII